VEDGDTEIESHGNDDGPRSGEGFRGIGGSGSDSDCDGDCDGDCEVVGSSNGSRGSGNCDNGVKDEPNSDGSPNAGSPISKHRNDLDIGFPVLGIVMAQQQLLVLIIRRLVVLLSVHCLRYSLR
jgi:hypothetical protein